MRLLITGGSGMLGSYVATQAAEAGWETWAAYSNHAVELPGCHMLQLDIRDGTEVNRAIEKIGPEVIIHTAALVKPDVCEQRKSDASAVNTLGAANVIAAAEKVGAHLVHISTDLVFSGERNPCRTDDPVCPVNHYGLTKAAAETAVRSSSLNWAIVRTSIIYGPRKFAFLESFSDKVIETLRSGETMSAFTDQRRCPIPAWNLADVLLEIADRRLTGIYHAVCQEPSTRYEFARKVAEVFGLDASLIKPIAMDEVQTLALRPKTLILDTTSTQAVLNTHLLSFEQGILELRNRQDAALASWRLKR